MINSQLEWYDNSKLETIDSCHRKGFWATEFVHPYATLETKAGLSKRVGNGAHYGTCVHGALAKYYGLYHSGLTEQQRRIIAIREFVRLHGALFPEPETLDSKHALDRGIDLVDMYFDHYLMEDQEYIPVESELYFNVIIEPRINERNFEPFCYCGRTDNVFQRRHYKDLVVFETKTTGYGVERELKKRELDRQTLGYFFSLKQFPSEHEFTGVMVNVLGVAAREKEPSKLFGRQYYPMTNEMAEAFRRETIRKVEHWRAIKREAIEVGGIEAIEVFDRSTDHCTAYGLCAFYDLCLFGVTGVNWSLYPPNDWDPRTPRE